ncbi:hypothetical protein F511_42356 [Dorcoceras hygrometricum]|uniref:Uncharacterized protein n=1 Tax=Dorcoceras hygrometricum TaxID=472368 RepID=A0A2Z7A6Y5_9LAMI|nr:hypothetical protein F511_42356 [Dorcoceras hygrometricum]
MAQPRLLQITIFLVFLSVLVQSKGLDNSRILDESPPDLQNKCGNCPCENPCNQPPPPPPPSPPPPPKKNPPPPSNYCPPPPAGQYPPNPPYIYINGPPGDLYPVDAGFSGSPRSSYMGILPFLISSAVGLLATTFLVNH